MLTDKNGLLPKELEIEFGDKVKEVFGDDLVFAFAYDSSAKDERTEGQSFDAFVCVKSKNYAQGTAFCEWVEGARRRYNLTTQSPYPCEVVKQDALDNLVNTASEVKLSPNAVNSADAYDRATWIQIFTDKKTAITGDEKAVRYYSASFEAYPELWKSSALESISRPERYQDKSPGYFLKKCFFFEMRPAALLAVNAGLSAFKPAVSRNLVLACTGK